tara:strand:+ start:428 stop:673 length:246 start_codon:yes stop_codon:yes gene_type:complete
MKIFSLMIEFSYKNETSSLVVLKCIGSEGFFLERAVFPMETFNLDVPEDSKVEIWGIQSYGPTLEERIRVSSYSKDFSIAA